MLRNCGTRATAMMTDVTVVCSNLYLPPTHTRTVATWRWGVSFLYFCHQTRLLHTHVWPHSSGWGGVEDEVNRAAPLWEALREKPFSCLFQLLKAACLPRFRGPHPLCFYHDISLSDSPASLSQRPWPSPCLYPARPASIPSPSQDPQWNHIF